jgi:hypothetical protein
MSGTQIAGRRSALIWAIGAAAGAATIQWQGAARHPEASGHVGTCCRDQSACSGKRSRLYRNRTRPGSFASPNERTPNEFWASEPHGMDPGISLSGAMMNWRDPTWRASIFTSFQERFVAFAPSKSWRLTARRYESCAAGFSAERRFTGWAGGDRLTLEESWVLKPWYHQPAIQVSGRYSGDLNGND